MESGMAANSDHTVTMIDSDSSRAGGHLVSGRDWLGSTLTILALATGNSQWFDASGKLLFADPGQTRYELLIDHGGTPADPEDDTFLEDLGVVKGSTGRNDLEGHDFCDDLHLVVD